MTATVANLDFLAFCLQAAPGVGAATLRTILRRMEQERCDADGFLALDDRTLQARFGLKREAVAFVRCPDEKILETWQTLQQKGVTVLVRGQAGYPDRINKVLGETAPPILYVLGRTELFQKPSVGFCGSRKASDKGLKVAEDASRLLAKEQVNVISGYAHGVDLAAHRGALEAGGTTTIVLAEGILHFRTKEQLQDALGDDPLARALVVSEFPPRLPWKAHSAMTRNRTICGLSNAMVVIESGLEGGTFEAGKTTLDLKLPLFCVEYAETVPSAAGNPYFLQHGAISLKRARNGQPNLSKLLSLLRDPAGTPATAVAVEPQLALHETPPPYAAPASQPQASTMTAYPKRLIEVDLPIRRISEHARREKSIRHGHISTLHIWWARRPLAACRAVICAALWPDPADEHCPAAFRTAARSEMQKWISHDRQQLLSEASRVRFEKARKRPELFADTAELRGALLDFIADFANWDNSTQADFLATSRALTQAAHEALGGEPGTRPLVVDPFAGGGSIPLEALRVGADAFASDLNPVPVLLNKVVLEYIPKYGQRLADEVRKWGEWIKQEAEKELAEFYPKDKDGATPIAYLWARTIISEAPGAGKNPVEVPLISSMWLANKGNKNHALRWQRDDSGKIETRLKEIKYANGQTVRVKQPLLELWSPKSGKNLESGTSKGGSATCPITNYTTSVENIRRQLAEREGGAADSRLLAVVTVREDQQGRFYRLATAADETAIERAVEKFKRQKAAQKNGEPYLPDGELNHLRGFFNIVLYGMKTWGNIFAPRQALALVTLATLVKDLRAKLTAEYEDGLASAIQTCLAIAIDRQADSLSSLTRWQPSRETNSNTFGRQALPMVWDYVEPVPTSDSAGSLGNALEWILTVIEANICVTGNGQVEQASATAHPLPNDIADAVITDPPYYAAIPYADLSDFFYSWLRKSLKDVHPSLFSEKLSPKNDECVSLSHRAAMYRHKDGPWFEKMMAQACAEGRRIDKPNGIGVFVFANKETAGWEAMLNALITSGWVITASWPIDTEMGSRLRAKNSAALASSVHLVCRPRENPDGSVRQDEVGDWRDVLAELPRRIHDWMPRLAEEGVVGADAIFACLGPALEIFSRYSRVEKSSGEAVTLKEYLEHVWAAVSKEALNMIFSGADATGFEEDARLTAMWLWTLKTGEADGAGENEKEDEDDDEAKGKKGGAGGFTLEFDAARKIAQGLGAHLESLTSLVAVEGETARLLPVGERAQHLFGKDDATLAGQNVKRKKRDPQMDMFKALQAEDGSETTFGETKIERHGDTVLDRIHQSMILFAAGRSEAMKRFLVEDGVGRDQRFWRLAQALSALYPSHTEEKRWVDGVLARKKGLGF